uniref:Ionotropic glutamate receptor C-terminal domain-containing protein n=1 Tax=Stomoxys calcitrans TaxID=35570 RepID=A0A1I8PRF7_STOCA
MFDANSAFEVVQQELWTYLLSHIEKEEHYEWTLMVGEGEVNFLYNLLWLQMEKSLLINQNYVENFNLHLRNTNFITIAIMPEMQLNDFASLMADKLDLLRSNRLIIIYNKKSTDGKQLLALEKLFQYFIHYKMLNVAVLLEDFALTRLIYTFEMYPKFQIQAQDLGNKTIKRPLFPSKVDNIYGQVLRTIPDQIMPRSVVYFDARNRMQVTGYVTQFVRMFGKYINSTLTFPETMIPGSTLFYRDFVNWTQLDLLDIPCSITPMAVGNTTRLMSQIFEVLSWCLMIPVEQPETYQDFLRRFLTLKTIVGLFLMDLVYTTLLTLATYVNDWKHRGIYKWNWVNICLNPQVILAHLGCSFHAAFSSAASLRIIYICLFVSGLLSTTLFTVQMNAFLTKPSVRTISSLDDMLKQRVNILASEQEFHALMNISGNTFEPYLSLFHLVDTYDEFADIRSSFNTSYAYPVTSSVWYVYDARQKLAAKRLFRHTNICLKSLDPMAFVLPRNSWYKPKVDTLILRVQEMGLLNYWLENNFHELVRSHLVTLKDLPDSKQEDGAIKVRDFYVVKTMMKAFGVCLVVFVFEIIWFNRMAILNVNPHRLLRKF